MKKLFAINLIRVLQLFLIVYLLIVLAVLIFQRRLICFPPRIPVVTIESMSAGEGFAPWKNPANLVAFQFFMDARSGSVSG